MYYILGQLKEETKMAKREFTIKLDEKSYQFYSLMAKHSMRSISEVLNFAVHDIPRLVWKRGRGGLTLDQAEDTAAECFSEE